MNRQLLILTGCVLLSGTSVGTAADKIIACPALTLHHYGKNTFYDPRSGRSWQLNWLSKQAPVWKLVSIPQTKACGAGKSRNGLPVTYQCAVFQCKSDAVVASLGQTNPVKCFSAYVSTGNTFYCNDFAS